MARKASIKLPSEQAKYVEEYAAANGITFERALEHMVCFFAQCVYTHGKAKPPKKSEPVKKTA